MKLVCDYVGFSDTGKQELAEPYWLLYFEHEGGYFAQKYADEPSAKAIIGFVNEAGVVFEKQIKNTIGPSDL